MVPWGTPEYSPRLFLLERILERFQVLVVVAFLEGILGHFGPAAAAKATAPAAGGPLAGPPVAGVFHGFSVILHDDQDRLQPVLCLLLGQLFHRLQALDLLGEFLLFFIV